MKKHTKYIIKFAGLAFVITLLLSSCQKWIDTNINVDPDSPSDVPMKLMLPAIEQNLGYVMAGNDFVMTTNVWMQQFDGVDRQAKVESRYQLLPADVNNAWNSVYTGTFMNAKVMIDKAENTVGKESPYNAGVARVLIATSLGIATDLFGDMPFSKAFQGTNNVLKPAFDSQEKLYDTLFTILDDAIADFNSSTNLVSVGGDVVYGGDIDMWKKAAYSIKARHELQLSELNGDAAYTAALAAAANGFTSNDDDFLIPWNADNHNPIFQFMEQRGDIRMSATLVDIMKANNDPRLPFYAAEDGNGEYTGSAVGAHNSDASKPGDYVAGQTAPSVIMSYSELKFIEAEANLKLGHNAEAQAAFEEAVASSVLRVTGSANTAWLAANVNGVPVSMDLIMTQKYINSFGTNQGFADYRRTGLPSLTIPSDALLPALPARFPYAQDEISYNGDNVPTVTISDKLWWDK